MTPNAELSDYCLALKAVLCAAIRIEFRRKGATDDELYVWATKQLDEMAPIINERFPSDAN